MNHRAQRYKTKTYLITSDFQCPYHDPEAVEIACQIGEELRGTPTELSFISNGDFLDFSQIGRFPTTVKEDLKESHERANTLLTQIIGRIKPNGRKIWLDGNHEDRLLAQMVSTPQMAQILNLPDISEATSISSLMRLEERKFEYVGLYAYGTWIPFDTKFANREKSIYIQHGNYVAAKSGATAQRHMEQYGCGVVVGHCHRQAVVWKTVPSVGGDVQDYLSAEGGTMSLLGVPGKGDNLYGSKPHRNPQIMNSQQGFLVLTLDSENNWSCEAVKITRGTAFFRGRLYRAVAKKRSRRAA